VFITRQSFLSIVSRSPVWEKTLKKVDSALTQADDAEAAMDSFARGDVDDIKTLVLNKHFGSSNRKAHFAEKLRRAVTKIKRMKLLMGNSGSSNVDAGASGFMVSEIRSRSQNANDAPVQASGFQTLTLSTAERCILEQLSKVQSSLAEIEQRADQRSSQLEKSISVLSNQVNSRISAIETKVACTDDILAKGDKETSLEGANSWPCLLTACTSEFPPGGFKQDTYELVKSPSNHTIRDFTTLI